MSFAIKAKLEGLDALLAKLRVAPKRVQAAVYRKGMRRATKRMAKAAKANLVSEGAVDTKSLMNAIDSKVSQYAYAVVGIIGPRTRQVRDKKSGQKVLSKYGQSAQNRGDKFAHYYAHLVEFGAKPHSLAKGASAKKGKLQGAGSMHPGARKKPFMRPAFDAEKAGAERDLADCIIEVLATGWK